MTHWMGLHLVSVCNKITTHMKCYPNIILIDFLRGLNPLRRTFYFNYIVQWDKDVIKKKCLLWIDLYTHGYIFAKCLMAQPPIYLLHFLLYLNGNLLWF